MTNSAYRNSVATIFFDRFMPALIASDDLLFTSVLVITLLYLWDSLHPKVVVEHAPKLVRKEKPLVHEASTAISVDKKESREHIHVANAPQKQLVLPYLPGCEPDGPAAREMQTKYPETHINDIVRYLVARKGNVPAASEMLEKCNAWRQKNFPLKKADVGPAYETGCMFYHGVAKDGSPVIYFRSDAIVWVSCV